MGQKTVVSGSPSQPQLMRATQCEDLNIFHKSSFKDTLHTQTYQEIEDKYKPTALLYFNENAYCSNIWEKDSVGLSNSLSVSTLAWAETYILHLTGNLRDFQEQL